MQALSDNFLEQCPVENGFRLRGQDITRIEVFVDAAFAFAVTVLVISFDHIPQSYDEFVLALKNTPAFAVAFIQLVWIWHSHSQWSERYGLRDAGTVTLSSLLLIVMLVYIYPMRIMFGGMFSWISGGYLPTEFFFDSREVLSLMFVFMGSGLAAVCITFFLMYRHAEKKSAALRLNDYEFYETQTSKLVWIGSAGVCVVPILLALFLPDTYLPFAGFGFALLGAWIPGISYYRMRAQPLSRRANGNGNGT